MAELSEGVDRRESRDHVEFLAMFLTPMDLNPGLDDPTGQASTQKWLRGWMSMHSRSLGEPAQRCIDWFLREGLLVRLEPPTPVGRSDNAGELPKPVVDPRPGATQLHKRLYGRYQIADLQKMLRQRGLPTTGSKSDLVARLVVADPEGMRDAGTPKWLMCSESGKALIERHQAMEAEQVRIADQEIMALIEKGEFREAHVCFLRHFSRIYGGPTDESHIQSIGHGEEPLMRAMYEGVPKALAGLDPSKLPALRLAAAMNCLWGGPDVSRWIPPGFETGLSMDASDVSHLLRVYAQYVTDMANYRQKHPGSKVTIKFNGVFPPCEACRKLQGKEYDLDRVPELPYEKCLSGNGCAAYVVQADDEDDEDDEDDDYEDEDE